MSIVHVITGMETIKWQTRAAYGCGSESMDTGLDCGVGCTSAVSVTDRRCSSSMQLVALCKCYACTITFCLTNSIVVFLCNLCSSRGKTQNLRILADLLQQRSWETTKWFTAFGLHNYRCFDPFTDTLSMDW